MVRISISLSRKLGFAHQRLVLGIQASAFVMVADLTLRSLHFRSDGPASHDVSVKLL